MDLINSIYLRTRLVTRVGYRIWKSSILSSAKFLIRNVSYESGERIHSKLPAIILSTFTNLSDFLILSYLFQEKELTFIAPPNLPSEKLIMKLQAINHILYLDDKQKAYGFFKRLLTTLRDFNRSLVISPDAAQKYAEHISIDPKLLCRIAMITNVPLIPVILKWSDRENERHKKCSVHIGKQIFVSPRSSEFKDIFFKSRGPRKFRNIPDEDMVEIGRRILSKLKT